MPIPLRIVLIVEDEPDIAELIRMEFAFAGWTVHVCTTADEALPLALQLHPDVMVIDVMLPGYIDGFGLCQKIKEHDSLAATAVVILTALGQENQRLAGAIAGCDAYLVKPFSPAELEQTARSLI